MESQTLHKFKWFWAWQDEKEETWLRGMSRQGWHLNSVGLPGFYTFARGEARDFVYRLDYVSSKVDYDTYLLLFQDAGWEHLGTMGGWQYFRIEALPGESPEIYTDADSKIQKYRRVLGYLLPFLPLWIIFSRNVADRALCSAEGGGLLRLLGALFFIVFFGLMLIYFYAIICLGQRIRLLKRL
jgi:hypothetical protein